jgi:hypothetical protein
MYLLPGIHIFAQRSCKNYDTTVPQKDFLATNNHIPKGLFKNYVMGGLRGEYFRPGYKV